MPHIILEYSANLEQRTNIAALVIKLHKAAIATGVFPVGGIRTRAVKRDHYRIADGDPDNAFLHVVARILEGRNLATRQRAGEALFQVACDHLAEVYDRSPLAISFEVQEIEANTSFKKNNLHERLKAQGKTS